MSEYQYYEFAAIERPLSRDDMAELRSRSSRATITATSFVNEYHWGSLKGNPADWMQRYFDAFVYTANWCRCKLALRVPHDVFTESELKRYTTDCALTVADVGTHWIIDWSLDESESYDRFGMEDGRSWMGRLAPLRDELLRGDFRPLYLGWLAGVVADEVDDNAVEPEVPAGMSQLSAAQQALVEFLEIDPDLLSAAAAGSQEAEEWHDDDSAEAWVAGLSRNEMRIVFNLLLQGASHQAERRVKSEFLAWRKENGDDVAPPAKPRKVTELRTLAEEAKKLRKGQAAKERARQEADRRKQREAYLKTLTVDFDRCWNAIHPHAERGTAAAYDEAKRAIVDLADAYALVSGKEEFDRALRRFMVRHAKRGALVRRLVEAGLWQK
ncbi:hypothetical protein [Noviherbaspirillum sedimenti]|uniref:Uncharacterized protein n=1 Tax=Noviherbaspirillum sedimenti TaxID=2320865 RepID=A0A3A3G6X9_9BURK|nr:hypothetical protein [Noviherbaspirillum sedimenti]RJG03584.1 hypothetical protein D3878_19935 [Noviherbaspirillum sedimenti]